MEAVSWQVRELEERAKRLRRRDADLAQAMPAMLANEREAQARANPGAGGASWERAKAATRAREDAERERLVIEQGLRIVGRELAEARAAEAASVDVATTESEDDA